jgi:predicted nicotinamide N-methyase
MANGGKGPGLIETPSEALGPTVRETVVIAGQTFYLERPDAVDRLSDHPELGGLSATDEYKPYWASVWPAARLLTRAVLAELGSGPFQRALEIGCGLGLPGIAALKAGLHVTFSDYDAAALRYAAGNARLNGFSNFELLHMDWRQPPADLRVPLLLASEPIYVFEQVEALADFIARVLEPNGLFMMADQGRLQAEALREALRARGMECVGTTITGEGLGDAGESGVMTHACHRRNDRLRDAN